MCVCVYLSADISLNCAKNGSTDYPEIFMLGAPKSEDVGMLGATMPRMYQILVTNQFNLRDYILYYPRDYRFPYRHNASLSL